MVTKIDWRTERKYLLFCTSSCTAVDDLEDGTDAAAEGGADSGNDASVVGVDDLDDGTDAAAEGGVDGGNEAAVTGIEDFDDGTDAAAEGGWASSVTLPVLNHIK